MEKIRYGMIGTGQMACSHAGCIAAIDDCEIVAAADPSEQSLRVFRHCLKDPAAFDDLRDLTKGFSAVYREFEQREAGPDDGAVKFFHDYQDLLQLDEVDAVIVSTPDDTHTDIVVDALTAGKHVLSEKPVAVNHAQLRALEDAVGRAQTIYQAGLECRYTPVYQRAAGMIAQGDVGVPRLIWCHEFRGPFLEKRGNWIMFQDRTGGVFNEKTCHYFDIMTWFAGSRPKRVTAFAGQDVVKDIYGVQPDIFDNGWALVEYENNVRATLGLCMFCPVSHDIEIGVVGDEGRLSCWIAAQKIAYTAYDAPGEKTIDPGPGPEIARLSHGGGVYFEHLAFIDNIRNDRTPFTDVEVAKWSTLVPLAAEESARNGGSPVTF